MYAKINYLIKLTLAYIRRFKGLILIGILGGIALFFLGNYFAPYLYKKTFRVGITGRYTTENLPDIILNKISSGLTKISDDGTPVPALATWESPDKGKTWIFTIKDDVYWQDGKKLTSDSVNYNFSDVEVEKPNPNTIKFKLKDIFVPFPSIVARPIFKKGLLGTGDWKVDKIKISGEYVSELILINATGEKYIYRFYPTYQRVITAYKLGQIDEIADILNNNEFKSWKNTDIKILPNKHQIVTIFFNFQDKYLGQKSLRQALTYAIDKDELGSRALSPIPSDSWAYNAQVKEYTIDVNHAKELLKDLPKDSLKDMRIKLTTSPDLLNIAEQISKDWNAIGIPSIVQVSAVIPDDYQAFLTILDVPIDPDQYTLWHSTQTESNISKYGSPRVDKLLEDGRTEINQEERKRIYLDFQRYLLEDLPAAFLIYPDYYTISRK